MGDWGYLILKIAITIAVILALTALVYWVVRRYSGIALGGIGRGRVPRLAVVDALTVDRRRRLLLVRRDNVEHLILIGGPSDLVVEPTIQRTRARQPARTPAATPQQQPPPEMAIVQELAQSGLGGPAQPQPPSEPPPAMRPEAAMNNVERLNIPADRPAAPYRAERRSHGAIDTQQLLDSITEAKQAASLAQPEPQSAPVMASPAYTRDFRVVSTESSAQLANPSAADDEPAMTKISDLEQEMARLLGQLNVKRP